MKERRRYRDRADYIIKAVSKRRKALKDALIEYKGGRCGICGYNRYAGALEFHHLSANGKDFGLSADGLTRSLARLKKEADKCVLVCSNCHKEIHAKITQPPTETLG